jgi:hypothetical protein
MKLSDQIYASAALSHKFGPLYPVGPTGPLKQYALYREEQVVRSSHSLNLNVTIWRVAMSSVGLGPEPAFTIEVLRAFLQSLQGSEGRYLILCCNRSFPFIAPITLHASKSIFRQNVIWIIDAFIELTMIA